LATLALISTFIESTYRLAVGGMVAFLGMAAVYFWVVAQKQLVADVLDDEEELTETPADVP
jgi:uncharacterized membrane protein